MHNFGTHSFRLAMAMMATGIWTPSAHAYLDPGTGSLLLQVLLGGVAGLVVAVRLYWHKLLSWSGARRQDGEEQSTPPPAKRRGG
jgi:hypothetical protein